MIRQSNPYNDILSGSWSVFRVDNCQVPSPTVAIRDDLRLHGGSIIASEDGNAFSLELPHASADAFCGLAILKSLDVVKKRRNLLREGDKSGTCRGFCYRHAWISNRPNQYQSFTRKFLGSLVHSFEAKLDGRLGFVIALDDIGKAIESSVWGNSFSIVTVSTSELRVVADISSAKWGAVLYDWYKRGQRTLKVLEKGRCVEPDPKVLGSLLLSSIGRIDEYSFSPSISPASLTMFATPQHFGCANLHTWRYRDVHGISLCASPGHWALIEWKSLVRAWREVLL